MKLEVDTGQLAVTVGELQETLKDIADNRTNMYASIEALNRMWKGKAHDAFVKQCERDNEVMAALIQDINSVFGNFGKARENYDACEESAKDIARRIQI